MAASTGLERAKKVRTGSGQNGTVDCSGQGSTGLDRARGMEGSIPPLACTVAYAPMALCPCFPANASRRAGLLLVSLLGSGSPISPSGQPGPRGCVGCFHLVCGVVWCVQVCARLHRSCLPSRAVVPGPGASVLRYLGPALPVPFARSLQPPRCSCQPEHLRNPTTDAATSAARTSQRKQNIPSNCTLLAEHEPLSVALSPIASPSLSVPSHPPPLRCCAARLRCGPPPLSLPRFLPSWAAVTPPPLSLCCLPCVPPHKVALPVAAQPPEAARIPASQDDDRVQRRWQQARRCRRHVWFVLSLHRGRRCACGRRSR